MASSSGSQCLPARPLATGSNSVNLQQEATRRKSDITATRKEKLAECSAAHGTQLCLLQARLKVQESVTASLSDTVSDLLQRLMVLESTFMQDKRSSSQDHLRAFSFDTPVRSTAFSSKHAPGANVRLERSHNGVSTLSTETQPYGPIATIAPLPLRCNLESSTQGLAIQSPFLSQDVCSLREKAFIWLNINVPQLHKEFGIAATLLEPRDNQASRYLPGNRMSQSMFESIVKAGRLGVKVERLPAEPCSANFPLCALQVRFTPYMTDKPMERRMAFAILPDRQMGFDVEIVRHDREDGLPDADLAFKYSTPEPGKSRVILLVARYKGIRISVHGTLPPHQHGVRRR